MTIKRMDNKELLEVYRQSIEINVITDFLSLLIDEIIKRGLIHEII